MEKTMLTLQTIETIEKRIKLATGVELAYVEQGNPAGVPVIFLHGITDSWHSFEPVLPHLPHTIHAFALTQRGHGESERPATGYRPQDFAADVAAFMDALQLERAVIAGHSMGSSIAQRFGLDFPERILGLVLIGSFASFQDKPELVEFVEVGVSPLEDPIDPAFAREFQESTLAQPIPPEFLETVVQESLKVPARVWKAAFQGLLEGEFPSELGKIKAPTLIVWGDQDAYCPRSDQETLRMAIAGSRLVVYAGVGHAIHWEEPARFAADLVAFVKSLR
jgi:pimeloyl-ACP methyl ester carboxylesterase